MPNSHVQIAPADGKLGVLVPGMGAVTTPLIAGLAAFKRELGKPVGSLKQLGTIRRLGKRTERRSPTIRDFVPLARIDDGTTPKFSDGWAIRCRLRSTSCAATRF